ncbi:MAG: sulfotransferase [Symploca sp. SIO2B6]|nr:sulfotransferase [Symploca sp. SIO2B6]
MPNTLSIADTIKPRLRALKYRWLRWSAEQRAEKVFDSNQTRSKSLAFILGCGRSGTTILGKVFSDHPQVSYLFEPYYLWAAIDRRTDALNLFHNIDASLIMNASHYNENSQLRFNRLIRSARGGVQVKLVIEKTPLNAMRIGYINALAPNSKFVHIVRNGVDVCYSINKIANSNSYKITGKPALNQWWGINYAKWKALASDGTASGYYTDNVHNLENNLSRGAYEWLVTLGEIDRWREALDDRLKELTYDTLTTKPKSTLKDLCEFFEIDSPQSWLDKSVSAISSPRHKQGLTVSLPPAMCKAFNSYQQRYGFSNRAACLEEGQSSFNQTLEI